VNREIEPRCTTNPCSVRNRLEAEVQRDVERYSLLLALFRKPYGGADAAEDTYGCGTHPVRFVCTAQESGVEQCSDRSSGRGNQKILHGSQGDR